MRISELLNENNVFISLKASDKTEAITNLVRTFSDELSPEMVEKALQAVLERESIMSTGVGKGLAIPHGKCPGLEHSFVAFARLEEPLDYGSIDKLPVSMLFLLIGPDTQNSLHIKMLSRISRLMNNSVFRDKLLEADDIATILELFKTEEAQYVRS